MNPFDENILQKDAISRRHEVLTSHDPMPAVGKHNGDTARRGAIHIVSRRDLARIGFRQYLRAFRLFPAETACCCSDLNRYDAADKERITHCATAFRYSESSSLTRGRAKLGSRRSPGKGHSL